MQKDKSKYKKFLLKDIHMDICIITGVARGLGLEMKKAFLEQGYYVIGIDVLKPIKSNTNKEENFYFMHCDLSKKKQIKKAFKHIHEKFEKAHILINNAAISNFELPIEKTSAKVYKKVLNTNLKAPFLCSKYFIKVNQGEEYGRIINIASTRWHQNMADWELYGMSKGGLISLTNTLCVSLLGSPITVNAISPGYIHVGKEKLEKRDHLIHPSNRVGKACDISRTCLFLAHRESDFINGANIIVDGGMTKKMIY